MVGFFLTGVYKKMFLCHFKYCTFFFIRMNFYKTWLPATSISMLILPPFDKIIIVMKRGFLNQQYAKTSPMIPDALRATYNAGRSAVLTWKPLVCFLDLFKPSNSGWNLASVGIKYFHTTAQKILKDINGFWKLCGVGC